MKCYCLIVCFLFSGLSLFAQNNDLWISFWNSDTTLIGFKDKNGNVTIEPKFLSLAGYQNKFENVIAAVEEFDHKYVNYYLTKSGKVFGVDSLYFFDNGFDCENEGFIRFSDKKTDLKGMFDRNGRVVVPAIYNDLTKAVNGMIVGLKGAEKKYWDNHGESGCNHFSWTGGQEVLIDTMNNILIEGFEHSNKLNFYTLEKSNLPPDDTTRASVLAKDGSYYSFVDFEKEFRQWITKDLLQDLTVDKLIDISFETIVWESKEGWAITDRQKLITDNYSILAKGLLEILMPNTDYFISNGDLNPYMYEGVEFEKYFNNCGEAKSWIYPTMSIVIGHNHENNYTQNYYKFLKTDEGYKLISLVIRNDEMK